jgi:hypothetical protein
MDLSDPKTWTDGLGVVVGAPHIVVPLLLAAAGGVGGFVEQSKDQKETAWRSDCTMLKNTNRIFLLRC